MDLHTKHEQNSPFIDTPDFTFTLPDLSVHEEDFRKFLEKDLIECSTLNSLENSQRLNWWVPQEICRKIWPLSTSGDGNCLLHAASLATWGFHDRRLTLRKALHNILSEGSLRAPLWRRWRFQQTRINKEAGLVFSEMEWAKEWEEIVALASAEPRNNKTIERRRSVVFERQSSFSYADTSESNSNATYDSLEEIHVLALSYVLRRPIIVISDIVLRDINGEALAPITFGGIYLPLDVPQAECNKVPLLLAYDMAHFSALVTMESSNDFPPALVPLIDNENILLPLQFCIDPGEDFDWREYNGIEGNWALSEVEHIALLKEYLEVTYASVACSPEDEIYEDYQSDDDFDKKILDIAIQINNEENNLTGTSNSPEFEKKEKGKKLQNVAKQFGSIGKSMSKKIKKNIAKFGKNSNKSSTALTPTLGGGIINGKLRLLCAQLRAKRHQYQEEMIKNYLDCAYGRFLEDLKNKIDIIDSSSSIPKIISCINSDCNNYGTEKTSWMCTSCYEKQKQREAIETPRYGIGNSKFYTQSDAQSHSAVKRLPSFKKLNDLDQTLFLGKSTFYNDTKSSSPSSSSSFNQLGIPLSPNPPQTSTTSTTPKTTIIPIKIEGRDDEGSKNLIQFQDVAKTQNGIHNRRTLPATPTGCFDVEDKSSNRKSYDLGGNKCRSIGCNFFGSPATGSFCSRCCQEKKVQNQQYRKLQTEI
jgi:OTU domain-containing protein 7